MPNDWSGYLVCREYLNQLKLIEDTAARIRNLENAIREAESEADKLKLELEDAFIRSDISAIEQDGQILVLVGADLRVIPKGYASDLIGPPNHTADQTTGLAGVDEAA